MQPQRMHPEGSQQSRRLQEFQAFDTAGAGDAQGYALERVQQRASAAATLGVAQGGRSGRSARLRVLMIRHNVSRGRNEGCREHGAPLVADHHLPFQLMIHVGGSCRVKLGPGCV